MKAILMILSCFVSAIRVSYVNAEGVDKDSNRVCAEFFNSNEFKSQDISPIVKLYIAQNFTFPQTPVGIVLGLTALQIKNKSLSKYILTDYEAYYISQVMNNIHRGLGLKFKIPRERAREAVNDLLSYTPLQIQITVLNMIRLQTGNEYFYGLRDKGKLVRDFFEDPQFSDELVYLTQIMNVVLKALKYAKVKMFSSEYQDFVMGQYQGRPFTDDQIKAFSKKVAFELGNILEEELIYEFPELSQHYLDDEVSDAMVLIRSLYDPVQLN